MTYKIISCIEETGRPEYKIVLSIKKWNWKQFKFIWEDKVFWGSGTVWREYYNGHFCRRNAGLESILADVVYEYKHFGKVNIIK